MHKKLFVFSVIMDRNKPEIIEKLKPFWEECWKEESKFLKKIEKIEKKMTEVLDLGIELEFIGSDEWFVGIGAKDFSERENFPLVHDTELFR